MLAEHHNWRTSAGQHGRQLVLHRVVVTGQDLNKFDFRGVVFKDAQISGCSTLGTRWEGAKTRDLMFRDANISGTTFDRTTSLRNTLVARNTLDRTVGWSKVHTGKRVQQVLNRSGGPGSGGVSQSRKVMVFPGALVWGRAPPHRRTHPALHSAARRQPVDDSTCWSQ